MKYTEKE